MNRVAIVTGASIGIGHGSATRLAREFSAVASIARTEATLTEAAEVVRSACAVPPIFASELRSPTAAFKVVKNHPR